jgi:hypothetical protein
MEQPPKEQAVQQEESTPNSRSVPPLPPLSVVPVDEAAKATERKKVEKSKTLATRRKRKKKKKQKPRVLKRVSSKNSINEMETIREDEEDDDEFEFEGSEYSTDDEDDVIVAQHISTVIDTDTAADGEGTPNVSPGSVAPPSPIQEEPKIKRLPPPWI